MARPMGSVELLYAIRRRLCVHGLTDGLRRYGLAVRIAGEIEAGRDPKHALDGIHPMKRETRADAERVAAWARKLWQDEHAADGQETSEAPDLVDTDGGAAA